MSGLNNLHSNIKYNTNIQKNVRKEKIKFNRLVEKFIIAASLNKYFLKLIQDSINHLSEIHINGI